MGGGGGGKVGRKGGGERGEGEERVGSGILVGTTTVTCFPQVQAVSRYLHQTQVREALVKSCAVLSCWV